MKTLHFGGRGGIDSSFSFAPLLGGGVESSFFGLSDIIEMKRNKLSRVLVVLLGLIALAVLASLFFSASLFGGLDRPTLPFATSFAGAINVNTISDNEIREVLEGVAEGIPRVVVVIGTRPEMVKLAPVVQHLRKLKHMATFVIFTDQHGALLDQANALFQIRPDFRLHVMASNQSLADLDARLMFSLGRFFKAFAPSLVVVQGDTTSAKVAAEAAFYLGIDTAHVEAGLRTFQRRLPFPEEFNRVVADYTSRFHFAPTSISAANLLREGIDHQRLFVVGNSGIDSLLHIAASIPDSEHIKDILSRVDKSSQIVLVTAHRRESQGSTMRGIFEAILTLSQIFGELHFLLPVHPNPNVRVIAEEVLHDQAGISLLPPLEYADFARLLDHCSFVITDSGGVQEEATAFGKPILVIRNSTERTEGVLAGVAELIGTSKDGIIAKVSELMVDSALRSRMSRKVYPYGDGLASLRIAAILGGALENGISDSFSNLAGLEGFQELRESTEGSYFWSRLLIHSYPIPDSPTILLIFEPTRRQEILEGVIRTYLPQYTLLKAQIFHRKISNCDSCGEKQPFRVILCPSCADHTSVDSLCDSLALGGIFIGQGETLVKKENGWDCFALEKLTEKRFMVDGPMKEESKQIEYLLVAYEERHLSFVQRFFGSIDEIPFRILELDSRQSLSSDFDPSFPFDKSVNRSIDDEFLNNGNKGGTVRVNEFSSRLKEKMKGKNVKAVLVPYSLDPKEAFSFALASSLEGIPLILLPCGLESVSMTDSPRVRTMRALAKAEVDSAEALIRALKSIDAVQ